MMRLREVRMMVAKPGIAFVEFEDDAQSSMAMQALQGFKITPQNPMAITYAKKVSHFMINLCGSNMQKQSLIASQKQESMIPMQRRRRSKKKKLREKNVLKKLSNQFQLMGNLLKVTGSQLLSAKETRVHKKPSHQIIYCLFKTCPMKPLA